ncbi:hypothetical protein ACSQ67_010310 [Phaseolus vulgaris]
MQAHHFFHPKLSFRFLSSTANLSPKNERKTLASSPIISPLLLVLAFRVQQREERLAKSRHAVIFHDSAKRRSCSLVI